MSFRGGCLARRRAKGSPSEAGARHPAAERAVVESEAQTLPPTPPLGLASLHQVGRPGPGLVDTLPPTPSPRPSLTPTPLHNPTLPPNPLRPPLPPTPPFFAFARVYRPDHTLHRRRRWTQLLTEVADELRDWQSEHARLDAELANGASSADSFPPHDEVDQVAAAVAPPPPLLPPQAPALLQRAAAYVLGGTSLGASLAAASRGAPGTAPAPRARPRAAGVPRGNATLPVAAEEVSESRC